MAGLRFNNPNNEDESALTAYYGLEKLANLLHLSLELTKIFDLVFA